MKVDMSLLNKSVIFDYILDKEDQVLLDSPVHMNHRSCLFELPFKLDQGNIHPDLLGMAILLMVYPFTKDKISLPFAISKEFADVVLEALSIKMYPVDTKLKKRIITDGRPGLSYSAGVDSTAALAIMPKNTAIVFLDRILQMYKSSLYNKSAALYTIDNIKERYEAYKIPTNVEFLREPIGFPVSNVDDRTDIPFSAAIPLILMADYLKIDSIAYGIVMESIYMVGHKEFDDFAKNKIFLKWKKIYEIINCELFLPTAGLTEVATSKISNSFAVSKFVRSCMRGDLNGPCKKCIKCFRKLTLDQALLRDKVNYNDLISNLNSNEVVKNLYSTIKHENVYRYIVQNLKQNRFTENLSKRISLVDEDTRWMERWYSKSIVFVPKKYQEEFQKNIERYLKNMTSDDCKFVEQWGIEHESNNDVDKLLEWQEYLKKEITEPRTNNFLSTLITNQELPKKLQVLDYKQWFDSLD